MKALGPSVHDQIRGEQSHRDGRQSGGGRNEHVAVRRAGEFSLHASSRREQRRRRAGCPVAEFAHGRTRGDQIDLDIDTALQPSEREKPKPWAVTDEETVSGTHA